MKEIRALTKFNQEDVIYTIKKHTALLTQDETMKKFFVEKIKKAQNEEEAKKKSKPKGISKETMERLYKPPETPKSKKPEEEEKQEDKEKREFVERILTHYQKLYPQARNYRTADVIKPFWATQIGEKVYLTIMKPLTIS